MCKVIRFIDLSTGKQYSSKQEYINEKKQEIWDDESIEPKHILPSSDSYSDYDLEREYFDGCPYCGSYEGDYQECPECGHGQ